MFGFLRGSCKDKAYRQIYAQCCQHQRRQFGLESLLFHSYEATFLYALAVDAGASSPPPTDAVTCCRLRNRPQNWPDFRDDLAYFCSSFALVLAATKLDDDIRDERSLLAWFARWRLRRKIRASREFFAELDPDFQQQIGQAIDQHLQMEKSPRGTISLEQYVEPTAQGFAYFFGLFARHASLDRQQVTRFEQLGSHLGAAIIAFDCAVDFARDKRRGSFNPLANKREKEAAFTFALRELSQLGWQCQTVFGDHSIGSGVALTAFNRVSERLATWRRDTADLNETNHLAWRGSYRTARGGFCDGCDCGGCDCGGCDGCGPDGCDACSPVGCCCDATCLDVFSCGERKKRSRQHYSSTHSSPNRVEEPEESLLVGQSGVAIGPLSPSGLVSIDGQERPARTRGEWIDDGVKVVVLEVEGFGLVVKDQAADT